MGGGGKVASVSHQSFWNTPTLHASAVDPAYRRTLGEGHTPITHVDGVPALLLKREDMNPTGSHKDRAASYQLALAASQGVPGVVISSSGNAGIATSRYAELHGVPAFVCIHPATDPEKIAAIDGATTTLIVTERAINTAKLLAREFGMPNLRPSTNDDSLVGYSSLGEELAEIDCDHVVIFATSGATAAAVAEASRARHGDHRAVHFVQGEGNDALVNPGAEITDASAHGAAAGRLGVRRSRRSRQLDRAIRSTGGSGHVASQQDVVRAQEALRALGIDVSEESGANYAVAQRICAAHPGERVVCIISGAPPRPRPDAHPQRIDADDEHHARTQVAELLASSSGTVAG